MAHTAQVRGAPSAPVSQLSSQLCSQLPDPSIDARSSVLDSLSVGLPNGAALLYGTVPPQTHTLTLVLDTGRAITMRPHVRTFARALVPDQLVDRIVLHGKARSVTCTRSASVGGYECAGSLAPSSARPPIPGVPAPPGSLGTAPSVPAAS